MLQIQDLVIDRLRNVEREGRVGEETALGTHNLREGVTDKQHGLEKLTCVLTLVGLFQVYFNIKSNSMLILKEIVYYYYDLLTYSY